MKKLISAILCICILLCIAPVEKVFAVNVTIFNVTVKEPIVGEELSYEASVPENASVYVSKVEWNGILDALGKIKRGNYEVRVTVRVKDNLTDRYIKVPSGDTVKVNGKSATLREVTADKKQAVIVYKFTANGDREKIVASGYDIVNTESNLMKFSQTLTLYDQAVNSAVQANPKASKTFTTEPEKFKDVIPFQIDTPVAGQKHTGKVTTSHPDIEITSVTWIGEVDEKGAYIFGGTYKLVVAFKIKDHLNKVFTGGNTTARYEVDGDSRTYKLSQKNKRAAYFTKTYTLEQPTAFVDIREVFTQEQADERYIEKNPMYPTELIVNEGEFLNDINNSHLDNEEWKNCIKKIVLNYSYRHENTTEKERANYEQDAEMIKFFPNLEEFWLGPNVNVLDFMVDYDEGYSGGDGIMSYIGTNPETQNFTVYVSDQVLPNGFSDKWNRVEISHGAGYVDKSVGKYLKFSQRLYSGNDVMAAYKKGPSATKEWCTNHDYSKLIYTADRIYSMKSCLEPVRYYYSCSKCGKCEYNPNHTGIPTNSTRNLDGYRSDHYITERNLSDKYYIGLNSRGERVYWKSCIMCGNIHNDVLGPSEGATLTKNALEGASLKDDYPDAFAVKADRYVTAKISEWAQDGVQWASQNGILDLKLLGNDYTKNITRLQFASVVVKLAEVLTGAEIVPAPKGTFTDTDDEYVRKAYAAGITKDICTTQFAPNSILTRQEMATFVYRALMYVRDNTNIRYTTYTPALEKYSDSGTLKDWAKTPMGFMEALGLIQGVSDTKLDPNGKCTIEQAVVVANKAINADEIGWYQVPLSTERQVTIGFNVVDNPYYYAPDDSAPTQTRYFNSDRIWVDISTSGGQKASELPIGVGTSLNYLATVDPYTGFRAWVPKKDFRPIKELKDTDVAEYYKYYTH